MKRYIKAVLILNVLFCLTGSIRAQSQKTTENPPPDSLKKARSGELVFDEILIEGVIEKPNVAILPTRERTEFGEIDFVNRSFSSELRALPPRSFLKEHDSGKSTPLRKKYAKLIKLKKR